jgi:pimeloyl-ACP methyl ester carboxylesterase
MSVSEALGERRTVRVPAGTLDYRERGSGPPMVFVHGAAVNGDLWRKVVPELAGAHRCITLDVPLGGHSIALDGEPDLSLFGVARIVADFLDALELSDVTIVANDTGGAVSQALVVRHPERIGPLVLTSCDAFENFPPRFFRIVLAPAAIPGAIPLVFGGMRLRPLRRLPIAYGWLSNKPIDPEADDSYVLPVLTRGPIRRDLRRVLAGIDPRYTIDAALKLTKWDRPTLIAWSANDRFFPPAHGERLAKLIPGARFELIDNARTFSAEDQPERLAALIAAFARERSASEK